MKIMRNICLGIFLTFLLATPAFAGLNVVATLPWIGSLAKEIGRDKVSMTTLIKPSQDPHYAEAKPSMILAARKADLIMYNGVDLEIGYLPLILQSARNPGIIPGKPGNFDCSAYVKVIDRQMVVDRSMGDVHPLGNPHYHFSTANILRVARAMANAMASLDGSNGQAYHANYNSFAARFNEHQKKWREANLKGKRFIAYHRMFGYLEQECGFKIIDYIEAKPGIPPSAAHIERLIEVMKREKPDGILVTPAHGLDEAKSLSAKTGVKVIVVPQDVGSVKGADGWFTFMDTVIASLK
jgi:zinc/manganese transport system substrate-binding protein